MDFIGTQRDYLTSNTGTYRIRRYIDRRETRDRRQQNIPVAVERRKGERRKSSERRSGWARTSSWSSDFVGWPEID